MAVHFLPPRRSVYHLDCVETHGVHVSLQATFHLVFGRPVFLLSDMSVSSSIFTVCSSFLLIICPYIAVDSLLSFGCLYYSSCSSNIFVSDLIFLCYSKHPSQHPHLIRLYPCFYPVLVNIHEVITRKCVRAPSVKRTFVPTKLK